jgi:hypothetical protein
MNRSCLAAALAGLLLVVPTAIPAAAQSARAAKPPRTPWGAPDLQGRWTNDTFTPLQRPAQFADKEFFTPEEAAELQQRLTADDVDPLAANVLVDPQRLRQRREDIHYDNNLWLREQTPKGLASLRTSLIVDPPNGRIPPLTPEARKRAADIAADAKARAFDGPESRPLGERCIVWPHEGPPLIPAAYNANLEIFQTRDYVVILQEIIHNARIIPLDGRAHLPAIPQWSGDSRGRWEGDTLVVTTKNINGKARFQGSTEAMRIVERFTRVDADTIRYAFTVEDPDTWTQPWTAEIPMAKAVGLIYEYACHEANYDLTNILRIGHEQFGPSTGR